MRPNVGHLINYTFLHIVFQTFGNTRIWYTFKRVPSLKNKASYVFSLIMTHLTEDIQICYITFQKFGVSKIKKNNNLMLTKAVFI